MEFGDLDFAAVVGEILEQDALVAGEIEHELRIAPHPALPKRMAARLILHGRRHQVWCQFPLQLGELWFTLRLVALSRALLVRHPVVVDVLDRSTRHAEEALERFVGLSSGLRPRLLELRRRMFFERDARVRRVEARRPGGAHVGRQILRIDRHPRAGPLQLDRCRQTDRAAADHGNVALLCGHGAGRGH